MAVEAFLARAITFPAISHVIERALEGADRHVDEPRSLADVRAIDAWAREFSAETIGTLPSS
jgi:1-deoxy-D-xylulose 5-phosphate reductoisomerase